MLQGFPALRPVLGLPARVPLGQVPFLHRLRGPGRTPLVVRQLPRYYGPVRLPTPVHRMRAPSGFHPRAGAPSALAGRGLSRFPREELPDVHGVSDRVGSRRCLALAASPVLLLALGTASAPQVNTFSRLNTQLARTPVNASPSPRGSRRMTRGRSGLLHLASYRTFTRYSSPAFIGAFPEPAPEPESPLPLTGRTARTSRPTG